MSKGINKVILIGYLGQDPEVRYTQNGSTIANCSLATSEIWKDKNTGERKEKTEWHKIVLFGKIAEIAKNFLKKGSQIYVEGSLKNRRWKDQNGNERTTTEIIVGNNGVMQMLGKRYKKEDFENIEKKNINEEKNETIRSEDIDFDEIPF